MKKITINTDSTGDIFVTGFNKYIKSTFSADHLIQLVKNFENCFEEIPANPEDLKAALKFTYMFLAEIGECYPYSQYAAACSKLSWIIDEEDPIKTAENIASLRPPKQN